MLLLTRRENIQQISISMHICIHQPFHLTNNVWFHAYIQQIQRFNHMRKYTTNNVWFHAYIRDLAISKCRPPKDKRKK